MEPLAIPRGLMAPFLGPILRLRTALGAWYHAKNGAKKVFEGLWSRGHGGRVAELPGALRCGAQPEPRDVRKPGKALEALSFGGLFCLFATILDLKSLRNA